MNQGKLEVVKQEMTRVNVESLGISELKWTRMGEFNSDDHYIYYCGQESLRRNAVAIMVNKTVRNVVLGCNLKNDRVISSFPRQTIQYLSNPSLCPNQQRWRSWSWMVLWRPTRRFRTNTPKRCSFHYRGLECKSRKSRNTWSNRHIWLWNTEWSREKANRILPRELTGHNTLFEQHKRRLYTWTSPDGQYWNQIGYIICSQKMEKFYNASKNKTGSWLWLKSWTPYCQIQT